MSKRPKTKALQPGERIDLDSSIKVDPVPLAVIELVPGVFSEQPARKVAEVDPVPEPEPRRFMPRDCTMCVTRRKPGESYSRVYSKHGKIRYCKCDKCGNTWAQEGE